MESRELRVVNLETTYNGHLSHPVAPDTFAEVENPNRFVYQAQTIR